MNFEYQLPSLDLLPELMSLLNKDWNNLELIELQLIEH